MARRLIAVLAALPLLAASSYQTEAEQWQRERAAELRADGGWLSVAGLFWLRDGVNTVGSDPASDIALPAGPPRAGTIEVRAGKVTAKLEGAARELRADSGEAVKIGRLSLFAIRRGDKVGIRLKDPESRMRREFHGLQFFPTREDYRVTARFVPEPRKIPIANVIGQTELQDSPGYAVFRLGGRELRLYPILESPDAKSLFFIFRDQTSGKETYGAGRFLDTDLPRDGELVLDFNRAYNPPCAFTPYATCPLPPKENRVPARIEAGEKTYGH